MKWGLLSHGCSQCLPHHHKCNTVNCSNKALLSHAIPSPFIKVQTAVMREKEARERRKKTEHESADGIFFPTHGSAPTGSGTHDSLLACAWPRAGISYSWANESRPTQTEVARVHRLPISGSSPVTHLQVQLPALPFSLVACAANPISITHPHDRSLFSFSLPC